LYFVSHGREFFTGMFGVQIMTATNIIARLIMSRPAVIGAGQRHQNPFWRIKNITTGKYLKIGRLRGEKPLRVRLSDVPAGRYLIRSADYSEVVNFSFA
jgi:hypothetical protein